MRLIFMGSPDFSVPTLEALVAAGHDVVAVYCQPPRPAGRGKKLRPTPVQKRAEDIGLMVRYPKSLRSPEAQSDFAGLRADAAVVVAYGLILPQFILDAPQRGCFNIHASLLPRWRGAAPIHRAVMAGDHETGVCIMQMDAGLDTGDVLVRQTTPITNSETTADVHDRLSQIGSQLMVRALGNLEDLLPVPQCKDGVTYADKIAKSEAQIDWTRSASEISRHIRGLSLFPGAWTYISGTRVKLLHATETQGVGAPGEVLSHLRIACGSGAIEITRLQRAGKSVQTAAEFLRGMPVPVGATLG